MAGGFARHLLAGGALLVGLCLNTVPGTAWATGDNLVTISGAWARMTPMSGAIFGTLHLNGAVEDRLEKIDCPDMADHVELHATRMEGGIMRMHAIDGLALPPGLDVQLEPGGLHIMLMGLKAKKAPGETVTCTMTFTHAPQLSFDAEVRPLGGMADTKADTQTPPPAPPHGEHE